MRDEQYLIPESKPRWWRRVPVDRWISIGAAVMAAGAVVFSALQYRAADAQARIAEAGLELSKKAAQEQAKDVERSRAAAEKSAAAAELLANAMSASAAAAQESARAGGQALALAHRQLVLGNLPRILVSSIRLIKIPTVNEPPTIVAQFMNNGKGAAHDVTSTVWISLSATRNITYEPRAKKLGGLTQLAPGTSSLQTAVTLSQSLTQNDISQIETGNLILFAYGMVAYRDQTFPQSARHTLYWCAFYLPIGPDPDQLLLNNCPEHNYTRSSQ